jgi:hypothetical protein
MVRGGSIGLFASPEVIFHSPLTLVPTTSALDVMGLPVESESHHENCNRR